MNWAAPPVIAGKPMPMIEPMLAAAADSMTPSSKHFAVSMRLDEEQPVLDVLERDRLGGDREGLGQARPDAGALAVVVVVEAGALEPRRAAELDHLRDDGLARVRRVGAAVALDGVLARLADLGHQLHVQLVAELERTDRVAGLGARPARC